MNDDFSERMRKRALKSQLVRIGIITVVVGLSAYIALLSYDFGQGLKNIEAKWLFYGVGAGVLFVGLFSYLQSGGSKRFPNGAPEDYKTSAILEKLAERTIEHANRLSAIEIEASAKSYLTEEQHAQLADRAIQSLTESTIKKAFDQHADALAMAVKSESTHNYLSTACEMMLSRLKREVVDLRLRANVNLLLGMFITAAGLILLWNTVSLLDAALATEQGALKLESAVATEGLMSFAKTYVVPLVPRVLLVVFIEVFAYFFLRLYKEGLSEAKYFQNEMTNVESRLIALNIAFRSDKEQALEVILQALVNTERNFVLSKGQTTVELERAKFENLTTRSLIKSMSGFSLRKSR